jgi:ABC-type Zn uptake system ZnuABC Zn-binding protein ZnuA
MHTSTHLPFGDNSLACTGKSKDYRTKNRPSPISGARIGLLCILMLSPLSARAAEIMATLPPLAGLVQLLQPESRPACLLPANADPHHFQLSPRQVETLQGARLLIRASRDDGGWPRLPTRGKTIDLWPRDDHAWLSPAEVRHVLPQLAAELEAVTGKQAMQLDEALATVTAMDRAWKQALAPLKSRGVIVQHPAWQHLLSSYGVPVHAVLEKHQHGHEGGPHLLEHALEALKAHPDALLLGDTRHSNRSLEWLARQSGKTILYLDALGQCGDSWQALMQQNLERLRTFKP